MLLRLFWLLVGHAIADYPLQGDFLAKAKNPLQPIAGIDPWIAMSAHCAIHAGVVMLVTHNLTWTLMEFVFHFWIDCGKCFGVTNFRQDQALHVVCKLIWMW